MKMYTISAAIDTLYEAAFNLVLAWFSKDGVIFKDMVVYLEKETE